MSLSSRQDPFRLDRLFLALVIVPTLLSAIYFSFFASDVYVSESRFVVRSPEKPTSSGLGVILKTAGFSNAGDEIYAAQDFVVSRDALRTLNAGDNFAQAYSRSSISIFNRFDPFGFSGSFEDLYKYYLDKVKIEHDTKSSITTLQVRAYSAEEAQRFNERLLGMAETTVNRLNERGRLDLIRFAAAEVEDAKAMELKSSQALAAFRNREGIVDPEKQAQVQLQMISKLQDELIRVKGEQLQLLRLAPRNPQIAVLQTRIAALAQEIKSQSQMVAGGGNSLAANAAEYQRLQLEVQFAEKQLAAALASLEDARNEARRKQAYVERVVQPNLPDASLEPRRTRSVIATLLISLAIWGVTRMLLAGVREHVN